MTELEQILKRVIARGKRRKEFDGALLLVALKAKSKPEGVLKKLDSLTRCEDLVIQLESNVLAITVEDLKHISDPLRVARRFKEAAKKQIEAIAIVSNLGEFKTPDIPIQKALDILKESSNGECRYSDEKRGLSAAERLQLEIELEEAVATGQLVSYYQPLFNLTRGTLTGFEALVRWEHPRKGLLLPGDFLEIAKQRGLLLKVDEIVLKQALKQIEAWNKDPERKIYVSVNLASDHFLNVENLAPLIATLKDQSVDLNLLRIDVSEQVLFEQSGIDSLNTLDMLQIGFNLDDFGVDSSSFHCLGSFPFNSLKIDRTLIDQMEDEVNAELIVAVLRIAKRMGMKTIAEGVVTHAQLEELRNLDCTEAQGFLFTEAV